MSFIDQMIKEKEKYKKQLNNNSINNNLTQPSRINVGGLINNNINKNKIPTQINLPQQGTTQSSPQVNLPTLKVANMINNAQANKRVIPASQNPNLFEDRRSPQLSQKQNITDNSFMFAKQPLISTKIDLVGDNTPKRNINLPQTEIRAKNAYEKQKEGKLYNQDVYGKGNIDLTQRPIYKNPDGRISTVNSMSFEKDGIEILIPTIIKDEYGNAKKLTEYEAIRHYYKTGEYLGKFSTIEEANAYANKLHEEQDAYYNVYNNLSQDVISTLSKYGIKPEDFTINEFAKWAKEHNFEQRITGNDLTGNSFEWVPKKKKGGLDGLLGKEENISEEVKKDKEILQRFLEEKNVLQNAKDHPVLTSTATVVSAPIRGLAGTIATGQNVAQAIIGKNVTTDSTAHNIIKDANLVRSTVTDEHASKWFGGAEGNLGNYGALAYNGLMSIGDMVVTSLTTRGIGSAMGLTAKALNSFASNVTSGLLASQSAVSTIMEKKKSGLSDGKAVAIGVATATAEFLTEKLSLDAIFKEPTSLLKKGIISFLAEGTEEMTSDVASKIADYLIAQDDSDIRKSISSYIENYGMSKENATLQTVIDCIYETLSSGLVGGVSGVAVGSAYHGASAINGIKNYGKLPTNQNVDISIDNAKQSTRDSNDVILPTRENNNVSENSPIKVGEATTIYNPYKGETPTMINKNNTKVDIPLQSLELANKRIEHSKTVNNQTPRKILTKIYENVFNGMGGARNITVKNTTFGKLPYVVTLNKNVVGKVISDVNMSAEKLAVFDVIDDVISNGTFVGSGEYIQKGNKKKYTNRFDYFETPVSINGKDYIVTFDVEVFPNTNNYRMHKIINKIDLSEINSADMGPVPTAPENQMISPNDNIPQSSKNVNHIERTNNVKHKPNNENIEQEEIISNNSSTGDIIKNGEYVYKNPTRVGLKENGNNLPVPTVEAEVYEALKDNENILSGELVDYKGNKKIRTPYVKNIVSTDAIPKNKRESIGRNIVSKHINGIISAINDLTSKGYAYSDPLQFAYIDGKLKLFDFSNSSKVSIEEATEKNYADLSRFLRSFGLEGYANVIENAIRYKELASFYYLEDIKNGDVLLDNDEISVIENIHRMGVKPQNVYHTKNKRMVQAKTPVSQVEIDGEEYVFSEKPLNDAEIDEWELQPIFVDNSNISYKDFGTGTVGASESNSNSYNALQNRNGTLSEGENNVEQIETKPTVLTKAQKYMQKQENRFMNSIGKILSIPQTANREFIRPLIHNMYNEFVETGKVSKETVDLIFEEAYKRGIKISEDYYNQYKDLKNALRTMPVSISKKDSLNIGDFNDFRKSNYNILKITKDGLPVDIRYMELNERYPDLFPDDIINPSEQLERMSEVAKNIKKVESDLDDYYGDYAEEFKAYSRQEFDKELEVIINEFVKIKNYNDSKNTVDKPIKIEDIKSVYRDVKKAKKQADKAVRNNLLTDADNVQIDRLLKGEIDIDDIPANKGYNISGIKEVYQAKRIVYDMQKQINEYNKQRKQKMKDEAVECIEDIDKWKQPSGTFMQSLNTMERNTESIVGDKTNAKKIIDTYFTPVHKMEANRTKMKNHYRDRVKKLKLTKPESEAVQFLGEKMGEIENLQSLKYRNDKQKSRLKELLAEVENYKKTNDKINYNKVNNAINEFRKIYNELFEKMNDVRIENGYAPVDYRKNYFPHFSENKDSIISKFGKALGIKMEVQELPTNIAGLTHAFKPGITWFGNAMQRTGDKTTYDAVTGFDMYIEGVTDVICHTENIQKLRTLANEIRYRVSDEGTKQRIDDIVENPNIASEEKQSMLNDIYSENKSVGSAYVQNLEEYTNLLANKKSKLDRNAESDFGRGIYNIFSWCMNKVATNMVAINPGSWLTNFIPITQAKASIDNGTMLRATKDALSNIINDDGFIDKSVFLTNRKGSDTLVKSKMDSVSNILTKPMEIIDMFTANVITRARYYQNVKSGLSEADAIIEADDFASRIMADRSKGAQPTRFSARNPITKLYTQFQLESVNQVAYLFKDLPKDKKAKTLQGLGMMLFQYAIGAFLYNELYEKLVGRRPALDGIGIMKNAIEGIYGVKLPNTVDAVGSLAQGKLPKVEKVESSISKVADDFKNDVLGNVPLIGGLLGGGRLPVNSALPNLDTIYNSGVGMVSGEKNPNKGFNEIAKELSKPAYYLLPPFGGGQAKKIIENTSAVNKGGSYVLDSDGNELLQYPIEKTPFNYIKGGIFGKSSLDATQQYYNENGKPLSKEQTDRFNREVSKGRNATEVYNEILEQREVERAKTKASQEYNNRLEKEVPKFAHTDTINDLVYNNPNVKNINSIKIDKVEKDITVGKAKYTLTDEQRIYYQKLYQQYAENAYNQFINADLPIESKVKYLSKAKSQAKELAKMNLCQRYVGKLKIKN